MYEFLKGAHLLSCAPNQRFIRRVSNERSKDQNAFHMNVGFINNTMCNNFQLLLLLKSEAVVKLPQPKSFRSNLNDLWYRSSSLCYKEN